MENQLKEIVEHLCSYKPSRAYIFPNTLHDAEDWAEKWVKNLGFSVKRQEIITNNSTFYNLIFQTEGKNKKKIIIGAHLDVCGEQSGADDNASAIAVLLMLAKKVKESNLIPNYTIEWVIFNLEEPPFFATDKMGSYVHAQSVDPKEVKGMICLEMLGYFSEEQDYPLNFLKWIYGSKGDFIAAASNFKSFFFSNKVSNLLKKNCEVKIKKLFAPNYFPGLDFSDHRNYWLRGIPAVMLTDTAFFRNPHYHQLTDIPDTLNYFKMAQMTEGLFKTIQQF